MPKMKSKSAIKKRFKLTASGEVKRGRSGHNHNLTKKNAKRKRTLRQGTGMENRQILKNIKRMLAQ